MREMRFQQFAIVKGETEEILTERLNAKLYELRKKNPSVSFEGMIARISYTENEEVCECLEDEYHQKGVRLTCDRCPFFEPLKKSDGTDDRRAKWGDCPHAHLGRTSADSCVCEKFYEMMNEGRFGICLLD